MGRMYQARCSACGCVHRDLQVGGGFHSADRSCFPASCSAGKHVIVVDALADNPRCDEHPNSLVRLFAADAERIANAAVLEHATDTLSQLIVPPEFRAPDPPVRSRQGLLADATVLLTSRHWPCPKCNENQLTFAFTGVWD